MDIYKAIGKRIANKRTEFRYTQEQLGELVGLHRNEIGYIERGERRTDLNNLYKIVSVLGFTLVELFEDY